MKMHSFDVGDYRAPKGTQERAAWLRCRVQQLLQSANFDIINFDSLMDTIEEERAYEQLEAGDGNNFETFEQFCNTRHPYGLGSERSDIQLMLMNRKLSASEIAENAKPLAKHGDIGNGRKSRPTIGRSTKYGSCAEYIASRLKRDRPDLLEKVAEGTMTMNKAALLAGIRKEHFSVPRDIPSLAKALMRRLDAEEILELADALKT